jgi:hypothetical protein
LCVWGKGGGGAGGGGSVCFGTIQLCMWGGVGGLQGSDDCVHACTTSVGVEEAGVGHAGLPVPGTSCHSQSQGTWGGGDRGQLSVDVCMNSVGVYSE